MIWLVFALLTGAAVMAHTPRKGEPVLFRNCYFMNLDWWGDAGGVYVRGEDAKMPQAPHAAFEDCTIVGPDNALQAGYPGVDDLCTRVSFHNCRLIVLNFSQPHGTPSSGIICCGCKDGRQLHVDLENCLLMGFKVFGTRAGAVSYSIKGRVSAYVQYRQATPEGGSLRVWIPARATCSSCGGRGVIGGELSVFMVQHLPDRSVISRPARPEPGTVVEGSIARWGPDPTPAPAGGSSGRGGWSLGIGFLGIIPSRIAASYTKQAITTEACIRSSFWSLS